MCASAADKASMTVLLRVENPEVHQSEPSFLPHSPQRRPFYGCFVLRENYALSPSRSPPQSGLSRASSPSASSLDGDEYSFFPFSKREYLLAQLRQKDELIDSLLKQVCLSNTPRAEAGAYGNLFSHIF